MKKIVLGLVCFTAVFCSVLTVRADDEGGTGGVVCNPPTTNTCIVISLPFGAHKTYMGVATVIVP